MLFIYLIKLKAYLITCKTEFTFLHLANVLLNEGRTVMD
jgi:hypothetical protein